MSDECELSKTKVESKSTSVQFWIGKKISESVGFGFRIRRIPLHNMVKFDAENICRPFLVQQLAFGALTLLVGCQEGHLARKNLTDEVLAWLSSGAKCK